jgi:cathepsin D
MAVKARGDRPVHLSARRLSPLFANIANHVLLFVSKLTMSTVTVDTASQGLIDGALAGIMGLAFPGIANTQAPPFWQNVLNQNDLTNPEFSFFITRFINDQNAQDEEFGGVLTLGGTNSTLFQGNIDFQSFSLGDNGGGFWLQTVSGASRTSL